MKKNQKEKQQEGARRNYVPPKIEAYSVESSCLLAGTTIFSGTHEDGASENSNGGHAGNGTLDGIVNGAKVHILNRDFEFSDVWED